MSSASDLVSLEQDTGLVKKMHERYILIYMEFVEANANNDCFNCHPIIRR